MSENNVRVTDAYEGYFVRKQTTGTCYLTEKDVRDVNGKYRWVKDKTRVAYMSYDAAQKARQRYGGRVVRVTNVTTEETIG
jgi:endo-beta-N-acetylglucosaminidase D